MNTQDRGVASLKSGVGKETIPGIFSGLRKRQFFTTVMLVRKTSEVPSLHLNVKSSIENSH